MSGTTTEMTRESMMLQQVYKAKLYNNTNVISNTDDYGTKMSPPTSRSKHDRIKTCTNYGTFDNTVEYYTKIKNL